MAFKMELIEVITTIVETALPRFSDAKKLLCVNLEVEVTKEGSTELGTRRFVHILFHRPNNYTTVMLGVTDDIHLRTEEMKEWKVTSCHDSCWRGDGVESPLFRLYIEMCKEVDPSARPMDLRATAGFSSFHEPKVVEVKNFVHDRSKFLAHIEWK